MTYQEFRKAHPATRCFQGYTSDQRANHAASHRLGYRQREAVGEFFYTHEMIPNRAFPTAKLATTVAYKLFQERQAAVDRAAPPSRFAAPPVRVAVEQVRVAGDESAVSEIETMAAEEAAETNRQTEKAAPAA